MWGVLVNTVAVLVGSTTGLLCKRGIPEKLSEAIMFAVGICVAVIGLQGALEEEHSLIMILSVVLGVLVGTCLDLDGRINRLGAQIEKKIAPRDSGTFAQGFVTASLFICIGAMAVVGSLQAALEKDYSILYTKSLLDFISTMVLAISLGSGVILSAASLFAVQGLIVLLAHLLQPILSDAMITEIGCVGSVLIFVLGLNMIRVTKVKVADFLPAILIAPILTGLFEGTALF